MHERAENVEPGPSLRDRIAGLPGIRILRRLGLPFYRWLTALYMLLHVARVAIGDAPELLDPLNHGIDTWTYYAAGQRLNDGHPLYALSPGDLEVPLAPPYVTVPLLSPPAMGVAWRPLSALHDPELVNRAWLLLCAVVFLGTVLWMIRRASALQLLALAVLAPAIALTAVSGNVNALLAPLLVLGWGWAAAGRDGRAGATVAVAALLKVSPAFILAWFLVRRSRHGIMGFGVAMAALLGVSLLGAGLQNHLDYLDVIRYTSAEGVSGWSLPAYLDGIGIHVSHAQVLVAAAVAGIIAVVALRHRPGLAWAAAVVASVLISPVVHLVALALLLPGVASLGYDRDVTDRPAAAP
jgi:hypothetical protein